MRKLILQALKKVTEEYPEIVSYLNKSAKKILEDGIEWHQKFEPNKTIHEYTPGKLDLTEDDIDEAIKEWNKYMPEYKGMLDAEIEVTE